MFAITSMDFESQDATKITSALADPRIYSSMKRIFLDMHMSVRFVKKKHMNAKKHFSQCLTLLCFQCRDNVDIKTHGCLHDKQFVPGISS